MIELVKKLTNDNRLLTYPKDLLKNSLGAYRNGNNSIIVSIPENLDGFWSALNDQGWTPMFGQDVKVDSVQR